MEPGDVPFTGHAMASLKRAMEWDERVYGLEYDLDEYNIVAVRHFNMGAMENKSLNIFNSKLVLADAATATDAELERIESVIAHEYFHNWTGNRITCRDWFQLSLKEGLTVFRDQSFTADLHGHALNRIENVAMLRNTQFREDAGPTAHPVQPEQYEAIDNFYTTTIYEKGSEVIRMLHTLLGEETFLRGMALYVQRHDGTAATCEDFVRAMQDAAGEAAATCRLPPFDFGQFRRWYHQAGTPVLRIRRRWNKAAGILELFIRQLTPPTPGQPVKQPLVIPLAVGLVGQAGPDPAHAPGGGGPRPWGRAPAEPPLGGRHPPAADRPGGAGVPFRGAAAPVAAAGPVAAAPVLGAGEGGAGPPLQRAGAPAGRRQRALRPLGCRPAAAAPGRAAPGRRPGPTGGWRRR